MAHELAHRANDGIEVTLLWHGADRLTVAVSDSKEGHSFEVPVEEPDRPLDVFHHPYAYAALRRVDYAPSPGREAAATAS